MIIVSNTCKERNQCNVMNHDTIDHAERGISVML